MEWKEELPSIFLSMGKERTLHINYIVNIADQIKDDISYDARANLSYYISYF